MEQLAEQETKQEHGNFNVVLISIQPNTNIIGVKYLHAYLQKNGITSRILILPSYNETMNNTVEKFFNKYKPNLVGLGILTEEFPIITKLTKFLKQKFDFATCMGGYQATIDPKACLEYVDYVIKGEAEDSLLEICQKMRNGEPFLDTPNLVYKKDGQIMKNSMRLPETNLDKYPWHENLPPETYIHHKGKILLMGDDLFKKYSKYSGRVYSLTTTRGCNFKCSFCIHSFIKKMYSEERLNVPLIRTRSVDNVMKELRVMKSKYPDMVYVNINDENFFAHEVDWIKEFSEKYKKDINIPISLVAIPIFFTEEKAKLMKECGLKWVGPGLQTGSEKIQREVYQRYISNEQFLKAAELIHKMEFLPWYDVILDNPFETEEDVIMTIDLILKLKKPYQLKMFSLGFYPGTVIYDIAKEKGLEVYNPFYKNYHKFKKTFLNRFIRLCPILPHKFLKFVVNHRKNKIVQLTFPLVYYPSITILEPFSFLKMAHISFNRDTKRTVKSAMLFFKSFALKKFFNNESIIREKSKIIKLNNQKDFEWKNQIG